MSTLTVRGSRIDEPGMSEFSDQLRWLMAERGVGVRELARRVPCDPGYLSNLRNGKKRPSRPIAARLDEALDADGALVAFGLGTRAGWPDGGEAALDEVTRLRLNELSGAQLDVLTELLADQWHVLVRTDNLLGPRHALGTVHTHLGVIEALLRAVRLPARQRVLRLAGRYAESAAWLHEDSGDLAAARYWTGRGLLPQR